VLLFGFSLINCWYTKISKISIILLTLLVLCISKKKLIAGKNLSCLLEFPVVMGFSILFLFFLTCTYDFFGFYLAVEGLSLTLYVLAGMLYQNMVSIESAVKYFSLGAISTGVLLFGISLLFGLVGSLDFLEIQLFLGSSSQNFIVIFELKIALFFILFGLFFKISAFPCH
jgi:NADH-quinone oxidoreductase subunit N